MTHAKYYRDIRGNDIDMTSLDSDESTLVDELQKFAEKNSDARTTAYWNFYVRQVGDFYERRGLSRHEITRTAVWRIAQDINSRLMLAAGLARVSEDYRDKLDALIREKFGSRREFCAATGISEDLLSHVFAKRKNLGIQTLTDGLAKIGYTINFTQLPDATPPSST